MTDHASRSVAMPNHRWTRDQRVRDTRPVELAMLGDRAARRPAVPAAAPAGFGDDLTRRRVIDHGTVSSAGCPAR